MTCCRTALRGSPDLPSAAVRPSRKTGADAAATSAPCSISTAMTSAWPWSAACINAVVPRASSFAFTSAPPSSSARTASTCPERAASISGLRPSGSCSLASAPLLSSASIIGCVALARREPQRRRAVAVGRGNVGAGLEQQQGQARVAVVGRPVQRRGAVGLCGLHVGAALHEAAHLRAVAPHRGIRHFGLARAQSSRTPRINASATASDGRELRIIGSSAVPCCRRCCRARYRTDRGGSTADYPWIRSWSGYARCRPPFIAPWFPPMSTCGTS